MKFFRACFIVLILISFVSCGGGDKTTDSGGNGNGGQNMPPASPSVPQPPNGVTNQSLTTTLSWTCSDPENDPLTYDVWFGTSPTPPVVASSIATASYRPSAMQYNNTYYWKVEAQDNHGNKSESPTWSLATEARQSGIYEVGHAGPLANTQDVAVSGNYAYVYNQGGRLYRIRVSDPTNPVVAGYLSFPNYIFDLAIDGTRAYALYEGGFSILSISSGPKVIGTYAGSGIGGIEASGNYAYYGAAGFHVIDVLVPGTPVEIGTTNRGGNDLEAVGNLVYSAAGNGLSIIDVSDVRNPVVLSSYPTTGNAVAIAVSGNLAFIGAKSAGLQIFDVSNPLSPKRLSVVSSSAFLGVIDVAVSGNFVFIAEGNYLRVIDISNPAAPSVAAIYRPQFAFYAYGIDVVGQYVYVATGEYGPLQGLLILEFVP